MIEAPPVIRPRKAYEKAAWVWQTFMKTQLILIGLLATLAANAHNVFVDEITGTNSPWLKAVPPPTNWIGSMPLPSPYTLEITAPKTRTITRPYWEGHNLFCVDYEYDPRFCIIPATMPPGKPHFTAKIRVRLNGQPFGNEFTGEVVPDGGCFEDRPEDMVDKARHAPKPEPVITQSATNGYMTNISLIAESSIVTNFLPASVMTVTNLTKPGDLFRANRNGDAIYISLDGVTNLTQLCGKIGHVWKQDSALARHCILCVKIQSYVGEWK